MEREKANRSAGAPIVLTLCLIWLVVASGCGGGGGSNGTTSPIGSTTGTVTDNPRGFVPWSQVEGKTNLPATMRVNDSGTVVTEIPAEIFSATIDTVNLSGRIETGVQDLSCQPGNNRGVYEGDSGSPVLLGGKVVGGLYGSANRATFGARGIQQEMATASGPAKKQMARKSPQWFYEGPPNLLPLLRAHPGFEKTRYNGDRSKSIARLVGGSVPPLPGRRYASPIVLGPYVAGYDAATYTYELANGNWVATAHGLEDAGAVSWPVTSFYVDGFGSGAVKGHIIGGIYGTLTYDGQNGSLINPNIPAAMMPVEVNTTFNSVPFAAVVHSVRFDHGSDSENQGIELSAQATIDVQLRNQAGAFNATGSAAVTVGGTATAHAFSFPANMSIDSFETSLGAQLQAILNAQSAATPGQQIQRVVVRLTVSG